MSRSVLKQFARALENDNFLKKKIFLDDMKDIKAMDEIGKGYKYKLFCGVYRKVEVGFISAYVKKDSFYNMTFDQNERKLRYFKKIMYELFEGKTFTGIDGAISYYHKLDKDHGILIDIFWGKDLFNIAVYYRKNHSICNII
jgi:hypothetical protein